MAVNRTGRETCNKKPCVLPQQQMQYADMIFLKREGTRIQLHCKEEDVHVLQVFKSPGLVHIDHYSGDDARS